MVEISASMVKELREKSGAAMMDCKKALVESGGDPEKAFEWLRQKGSAAAIKKSSRVASEGLVVAEVTNDGRRGAILEINCETDFVARNEQFVGLSKELVKVALESKAPDVAHFLEQKLGSSSVKEKVTEAVAKTGENIVIRRLEIFELSFPHGVIGLYVHALGGKMGALVELESNKEGNLELLNKVARELAMHVVSAKPQYISKSEIPKEMIENEKRIESGKADLAEKKPEMREKIVAGRVDKILSERCLLDQPFVKEPSLSVGKYLSQKGSELGVELNLRRFALFILGEAGSETNGRD
jgi:elongation factor Ts